MIPFRLYFTSLSTKDTDCSNWDIEIELLPQDTGIDSLMHEHGISDSSNYYSHTFDEVGNAVWKANVVILSKRKL